MAVERVSVKDVGYALAEFEDGWGELAYVENEVVDGIDGLVSGVEKQGGAIGDREYSHVVVKIAFADGDIRFFKKVGCYTSYDGTTWDGPFTEVVQTQKVVTVWE